MACSLQLQRGPGLDDPISPTLRSSFIFNGECFLAGSIVVDRLSSRFELVRERIARGHQRISHSDQTAARPFWIKRPKTLPWFVQSHIMAVL